MQHNGYFSSRQCQFVSTRFLLEKMHRLKIKFIDAYGWSCSTPVMPSCLDKVETERDEAQGYDRIEDLLLDLCARPRAGPLLVVGHAVTVHTAALICLLILLLQICRCTSIKTSINQLEWPTFCFYTIDIECVSYDGWASASNFQISQARMHR